MGANAVSAFKGDNKTIQVTITDSAGAAIDTTGWTVEFTLRDQRGTLVFTLSSSGAQITGPTGAGMNVWDIDILPADLPQSLDPGEYCYDVQATTDDPTPKVHTVVSDRFTLQQDQTHA